ncbi:MAG: sterol desaturase family protein [Myxococcales bacterium]|nr:sterol desaturase family protein [Myxococcales bacterium]
MNLDIELVVPLAAILAFDGALLFFLTWAYYSPRATAYRISPKTSMNVSALKRLLNIAMNSVLSLIIVFGLLSLMAKSMLHGRSDGVVRTVVDVFLILLVYDFAYYGLHRLMHLKSLMQYVHGVHHRVHNPTAMESFYLHPVELFAGIALLMTCTLIVGPVSNLSFLFVFAFHSTLNIVVHSGLTTGLWLLRPLDHLMVKHHIHHRGELDANLASLTPLPDIVFGTAR